jgi:hypothetical protein
MEGIRKTLKANSLNDTTSRGRDHITQKDYSSFSLFMLSYNPAGKRSLGHPRKRWRRSQICGAATDESPMRGVEFL